MRHKHSEYMHWAKTQQKARYTLATSGVGDFPLKDLPVDWASIEFAGKNSYGYEPLLRAIAKHQGVDWKCVVEAAGTSMANHLAMAALIEPGDEVVIEQPVYGPVLDAALYLGASVKRFARREESGWVVDPEEVRRAVTPKTRLIVITNLHNPTSALTPEPAMREVGEIARRVGAMVLVDEVYLDAVYENTPRSAFHLGEQFVTTSSLTKIYGVSGLRCGWILARPDLAGKMRLLNDVFGATPVFAGEWMSEKVFEYLPMLRDRTREIVKQDRAALAEFLAGQPQLSAASTEWGTTCFVRLKSGGVDAFLERLRADFETSAVPGRFFECPDHFRIGMGQDSAKFAEGLKRVGLALASARAIA